MDISWVPHYCRNQSFLYITDYDILFTKFQKKSNASY